MKTKLSIADKNGYIYQDGKLMSYQFISALINFESGRVDYTCKVGGKDTILSAYSCPKIYEFVEDFQSDTPNENRTITWADCIRASLFYVPMSVNDNEYCDAYFVRDNQVVSSNAPSRDFLYINRWDIRYSSETKYFRTRSEANLMCDTICVNEKGEEVVIPSVARRLQLNEDQALAVENLRLALARARELNVRFILNADNSELSCYNSENLVGVDYDCEDDIYTSMGVRINSFLTEVGESLPSAILCDVGMYAKFK